MSERSGEVITFYSYKGGAGRSMALANIACLITNRKLNDKSVLMIDWDLEAPGLHRFFKKNITDGLNVLDDNQIEIRPGLIDLFRELNEELDSSKSFNEANAHLIFDKIINSGRFILETNQPSLYLLKAGSHIDSKSYNSHVSDFNWVDLFQKAPWLIRSFANYLSKKYDYILIDSRAGITNISGISTILMPDKLVVVFTPSQQSIEGVLNLVREAIDYRKKSNDLRPLIVFPLPSRIDASEPELRKMWRKGDEKEGIAGYQPKFENAFKILYKLENCDLEDYFRYVQIQHVPRYAYGEEIAVLVELDDRFSLTQSYQSFLNVILESDAPWDFHLDADEIRKRAKLAHEEGDFYGAMDFFKQSLALNKKMGNWNTIAAIYNDLAKLNQDQEYYEEALRYYKLSMEIREKSGDKPGLAAIFNNMGMIYREMGRFDQAVDSFEMTLRIRQTLGDQSGIARAILNLGITYREKGDFDRARKYLDDSMKIRHDLGDQAGIIDILVNLGYMAKSQKDYEEAEKIFARILEIRESQADEDGIAGALCDLGMIAQIKGDNSKAKKYYELSLKKNQDLSKDACVAVILNNLGDIQINEKNYAKAKSYFEKSLRLSNKLGEKVIPTAVHCDLGVLCQNGVERGRKLGESAWIPHSTEKLGEISLLQGNYSEAKYFFEQNLEIHKKTENSKGEANALYRLGIVAMAGGNNAEARKLFEQSLEHIVDQKSPFAEIIRQEISRLSTIDI